MSESATYRYRLAAARRRELHLERVRDTTAHYLRRYTELLDDVVRQGLAEYVPAEVEQARRDLAELRARLDADPEAARELSRRIGSYLGGLPALGRAARREFEQRARDQERQLREEAARREQAAARAATELLADLDARLAAVADPVVRDFAFTDLRELHRRTAGLRVEANELPGARERLARETDAVLARAADRAAAWKAERQAEGHAEARRTLLAVQREAVAADLRENPAVLQGVLDQLDALRARVEQGNASDADREAEELVGRAAEAVLDERARKETVRALVQSLKAAGFVIAGPPQRQRDGGRDEVLILARKPSGSQAEARIDLAGDLAYCFDGYEGTACKKDLTAVLAQMQEIYGVKLSDKVLRWSNPDRLTASARPLDGAKGEANA